MYVLSELVDDARRYLTDNGYSESTIGHHETAWKRLAAWCAENSPEHYDRGVERRYLEASGLDGGGLTKSQRASVTAIRRLIEMAEDGRPAKPAHATKHAVPDGLLQAYDAYGSALDVRGLGDVTRKSCLSTARHFLSACGAQDPSGLGPGCIATFVGTMRDMSPQTRAGKLYVVRDLARTLEERGMCDGSLAASMPVIPGHKHCSAPSSYSTDEVSLLLASEPSGRCPSRTRAVMLLAAVLGMRVGDIKSLRLADVDWRMKRLTFTQSKTGVGQVLPMPDEVWLALADYVRNERPDVCDGRLFVTACAPHHPIDSQDAFHRSVTRRFADAGVDFAGKHHGMHSLRHSAATNMLAEGTPYPTISAVPGHSSTNVTRRHLSIDVESLRDMALGVPTCR